MTSVFRLLQTGTTNTELITIYEVSFYNSSQVAQAFVEASETEDDFSVDAGETYSWLLSFQGVVGDGSQRIAKIRQRLKHDTASANIALNGTAQLTALSIDETSGNTSRTYNAGSLS